MWVRFLHGVPVERSKHRVKIKKITEGVRYNGDSQYIIDMRNDYEQDIIHTCISDELYYSNIQDNVYVFGYKFRENASSKQRTAFLEWLKSHKDTPNYLTEFINRPLVRLQKDGKIKDIDILVYPKSERNSFVPLIGRSIITVLQDDTVIETIEAVKNTPSKIYIDYDALKLSCKDEKQYEDRLEVLKELENKIHDLSYFSLSQNVKYKYRPFIRNFLRFDKKEQKVLASIERGSLLVIDDVNTSNTTINELIRRVKAINKECIIYIFTLIGKSFD